ncbi:MAG: TonB-dependent receptor [Paludibacter sp.]|nr:TonB-dependent receptor [Paludibacter sp.]MBP8782711.1 TonB-dependent receptor [Paludibacter sp.]
MKVLRIIIFSLLFFTVSLSAQRSIQSSVFDAKNGQAIEMATVRLLKQKDSALVQGAQTDMKGGFTLPKVRSGNYILLVSSVGYHDYKRNITMENKDLILKAIQLNENVKLLNELEVKGTAAQLVVKGDTVEYNAAAFKTQENAAVEELLKKLPGVEISADGKITVNGEDIKKIRVDGKKFFEGDIEQATKNLPADMIEKIQVLEQKSDMALLTGFEDGDTERIINLTTKPNRRKGVFGNMGLGAGLDINNDFRYDGSLSMNIMRGESQTNINAGANNLNTSRGSRGRGSWGGANSGITTSQNLGINNNTIINPKFKIGGDVTFNHSNNLSETETERTSYISEKTYDDWSKSMSGNDRYSTNLRLEAEWKIDSLRTIVFQPNMGYNQTESFSTREYRYLTEGDSTSWGDSKNSGFSNSLSGGLNVIYNQKSAQKKGRSFTLNLRTGFSESNSDNMNLSNKFTNDTTILIDQNTINRSNNFNSYLRMSFVEPLWNNKNMLEAAVSVSNNTTKSVKEQFGKDVNGDYTIFNDEYSNNFENIFFRESIELNYRFTEKDYNIMLGVNGEPSQTRNLREYGNGFVRDTTYGVFNFAPTGRFQYNFGRKTFARIDYRGRTQQPSIDQMQPVKNNSDLMNETVGNPSLNPAFSHNLRLMYSQFNDKTFSSFSTFLNTNLTKDALVSNRIYDSSLKQYNQTVNLKDAMPLSLNWNVMFNTPLIQKRLHFNTNTSTGYRTQYGFVSRGVNNEEIDIDNLLTGASNFTRTYNAAEEISLTFTHDVIEMGVRGRIGYNNSLNSQKNVETETWDWMGRGNLVIRFPYDFTLSSDIAYSDRAGYTNMDQSEIMWNAALDKSLFKKKGTLSLRANDILRQRLNIRQTIGDNYVQYSRYNTLPSYFIVSFTYKINQFGGRATGENNSQFGPGMRPERGSGGGGGRRMLEGGGGMF